MLKTVEPIGATCTVRSNREVTYAATNSLRMRCSVIPFSSKRVPADHPQRPIRDAGVRVCRSVSKDGAPVDSPEELSRGLLLQLTDKVSDRTTPQAGYAVGQRLSNGSSRSSADSRPRC